MKNTPLTNSAEMHAELSPQRERERRALIVENCLLVMQLHALTGVEILTLANKWHRGRALANWK